MTLTKADIIDNIYRESGLRRIEVIQVVETLLEIVKDALESGEDVLISRFGKFELKNKNQRRGRNPQTGADLTLGAKRIVTFKYSGVLKDKLNKGKA